jgi:alanine-synthesizing transaminase
MVENKHRIRQAVRNIKGFLQNYDKVLEGAERQRVVIK